MQVNFETRTMGQGNECWTGRRVIVFGAGYLGGQVVRTALARGAQVRALTRNPARAEEWRSAGAEVWCGDLLDPAWAEAWTEPADWALNAVSAGGGGPAAYWRNYVEGMSAVLRWGQRRGIGTLVYTSSTAVYPQTAGARVGEEAPTGGERPTVAALVEAERRCLDVSNDRIQRRWVLRLAGLYGPGRHLWLDRLRAGETRWAGDPEGPVNLIHRDDAAAAIIAAWQAPAEMAGGVLNGADDGGATRGEVVAWLAGQLGMQAPAWIPAEAEAGRPNLRRTIANDRLKAWLGWRPRYPTFREGYAALLAPAAPAGAERARGGS